MLFIDFDPFLFFLMGFDCFEHDGGRCGWGTVWMGAALNKFDLIGCVFYGGNCARWDSVGRSVSQYPHSLE